MKDTKTNDCFCWRVCFISWGCEDKFLTMLELVVRKKMKVKITRDEGWFSELEMKNDLKWSA